MSDTKVVVGDSVYRVGDKVVVGELSALDKERGLTDGAVCIIESFCTITAEGLFLLGRSGGRRFMSFNQIRPVKESNNGYSFSEIVEKLTAKDVELGTALKNRDSFYHVRETPKMEYGLSSEDSNAGPVVFSVTAEMINSLWFIIKPAKVLRMAVEDIK